MEVPSDRSALPDMLGWQALIALDALFFPPAHRHNIPVHPPRHAVAQWYCDQFAMTCDEMDPLASSSNIQLRLASHEAPHFSSDSSNRLAKSFDNRR